MARFHAMFVHAHPDDESSKGAATMARYAKEGHRVSVVTLTDGSAGDILNPAMEQPGVRERLTEIRKEELARALQVLGVSDHVALGYRDSGYVEEFDGSGEHLAADAFYNVPLEQAIGRLVAVVRDLRPDVLLTYPPGGGYPHPDHIRCHDVAAAAFDAAADPTRYPDAGPAWQVRKLYWMGAFNRGRVHALHQACLDLGVESPYDRWLERLSDSDDEPDPTTRVHVGDFLHLRTQALLAHATQVDPKSFWFAVPDDVVRDVYPWEDFELARSRVEVELPEDSLFAGL